MANKEEQIEKIAREEVFPQRYSVNFPGTWPSVWHQAHCLQLAENIYKIRQAESRKKNRKETEAPVEVVAVEAPDEEVE